MRRQIINLGVRYARSAKGPYLTRIRAKQYSRAASPLSSGVQKYGIVNAFSALANNRDVAQGGASWDNWTQIPVSGGTITLSGTNNATATCGAPTGGRAILQFEFDYEAGKYYAVTVDVSAITVAASQSTVQVNAQEDFGSDRINASSVERWGILFRAGASSSGWVRMGCGVNAGVSSAESVDLTKPQIEEISAQRFSNWVRTKDTAENYPGNTFSGTSGIVIAGTGGAIAGPYNNWTDVMGVGDSWANEITEWPIKLDQIIAGIVRGDGYPGGTLSGTIAGEFATLLAVGNYTGTVLQGGVNDCYSGVTLTAMQNAVNNMKTQCDAKPCKLIMINIGPTKGSASWDTTKQAAVEAYNSWLAGWGPDNEVPIVDAYRLLEDPANADQLNPIYDSGDQFHPNEKGMELVASAVRRVMR